MKRVLIVVFVISLIACNNSKQVDKAETNVENKVEKGFISKFSFSYLDTVSVSNIKYSQTEKGYRYNVEFLDSIDEKNWTDKFMPEGLVEWNIYSAYYHSFQSENENFKVITVYTVADDWAKLHLLTIDKENLLIDEYEIGESTSYFIDQFDTYEVYANLFKRAIKLSDKKYEIESIEKTTFDYFDENVKDSIVVLEKNYLLEIDSLGNFKTNKNAP